MRRLLLRALWRFFGRRAGWVAAASFARMVLRRGASRQVDDASADLEQRLPEPVRNVLNRVPGDPIRFGGSAVVAGRSARQAAVRAGRVTRAADQGRRRVGRGIDRAAEVLDDRPRPVRAGRDLANRLGVDLVAETETSHREMRSRMLANSSGQGAADDALLDLRPESTDALLDRRTEPGEAIGPSGPPPPVRAGRWRAPRRRARDQVSRVQRTYHQPRRSWDR